MRFASAHRTLYLVLRNSIYFQSQQVDGHSFFFSDGLVPLLMKKTRGVPLPIILVKGLYEILQIPSEVNRSTDILFFFWEGFSLSY